MKPEMPYCPECRYEYREGVEKCPDCDVELVEALPDLPDPARDDLVCVASYPHQATAQTARIRLESRGIPSTIVGETVAQVHPWAVFADGGLRVMVREADLVRARAVLESK